MDMARKLGVLPKISPGKTMSLFQMKHLSVGQGREGGKGIQK